MSVPHNIFPKGFFFLCYSRFFITPCIGSEENRAIFLSARSYVHCSSSDMKLFTLPLKMSTEDEIQQLLQEVMLNHSD